MTKVGYFPDDVVGSTDVTLVVHWSGGWVTGRRSSTWSANWPTITQWSMSIDDDGIIELEVEGQPERRFRRSDVGIGRRFPDIRHYWLSEEVT